MDRLELEDAVWELPYIKNSTIDFDVLQRMSDQQLHDLLEGKKRISTRQQPIKLKWRQVATDYVERDGKLYKQTTHSSGLETSVSLTECGDRVMWRGKQVSSSIVLHWLRTGNRVERVPKLQGQKPYRAVIRIGNRIQHLGYYSSKETRDEAVALAKMGILPNGLK